MSKTSIQTSARQQGVDTPRSPAITDVPERTPRVRHNPLWKRILAPLASLRLTVVLFALSLVLVFLGTLAQIDAGIWTVVKQYFRSLYVWVPLQLFVRFAQVFFYVPKTAELPGSFPFPGGWLLGTLLLINLLAAHVVRFRLTWKRSGILVLHSGLVIMMLGELVTGLFAVEGNMTIEQGGSSNYLEHRHAAELAIIDPSDPKTDQVVVIPGSLLRKGGVIHNDLLPFDVEVKDYQVNSKLADVTPGEGNNPATVGEGREVLAVAQPENRGVDTNGGIDIPSAYLTFRNKDSGAVLGGGTFLTSVWFSLLNKPLPPQHLSVDGKTYDISLRFRRTYKPYTVYLKQFTHKIYMGTDTPKDFRSEVRVVDPARGEDRDVEIYMNHPLRYHGETFYQSSFLEGDRGTVLQVVRNPGWLLPYVSCAMVSLGMLVHFLIHLTGFLRRKMKGVPAEEAIPGFGRYLPWAVVGMAVLFLFFEMPTSDPPGQMQLRDFGTLPVVDRGRVKPFDTYARTTLMAISNRQEFKDLDGHTQPAVKWALDVMTSRLNKNSPAQKYKVFRIENDQVLDLLGLQPREGLRYAIDEFADKIDRLEKQAARSRKVESAHRDLFDIKVLELAEHLQAYVELARLENPLMVPPPDPDQKWEPLLQAVLEARDSQKDNPAAQAMVNVLFAYADGKTDDFNRSLAAYHQEVEGRTPQESSMAGFEVFFNEFQPFYWCTYLYAVVFLLVLGGWVELALGISALRVLPVGGLRALGWVVSFGWRPLLRTAFWLAVLTLLVHTWALGARMYIQGRPPVTNLYSSAVFIGWVCLVVGLVLEMVYRNGIGSGVAAVTGGLTVLIAHHLAGGGDTLEMLQAVLDTNFWLATHVTCVTIGYAATFFAGFLGFLYIIGYLIVRTRDNSLLQTLGQMMYGIICFATLFSFTGTVLGGIWADQSWGRFWGWDPKENGALLIVIWNALILHARWGGMIKQRGMAVLAVVGNMVTGWSWFGTNQLGVGLHAYGFNNTLAFGLVVFWAINVLFLAAALLPVPKWPRAPARG